MINRFFRESLNDFQSYEPEIGDYKIKLDANEAYFNFPMELVEEMLSTIKESLFNRYPDPSSLKVCSIYSKYAKVPRENIIAGNGSDELIQIIVNAFVDKDDNVLVITPDFSMYNIYTKISGGNIIEFQVSSEFKLDIDGLITTANESKVKILFLSNPNNPTGQVISRNNIIKIIEGSDCIVVIDEAYYEFYGESVTDLVSTYENLIVLRTCSKAVGLAALRLGFLITGTQLISELKKVKPPFNVNSISQEIASVVLSKPEIIQRNLDTIIEERDYLYDNLTKMAGIKPLKSNANFILFKIDNSTQVKYRLQKQDIIVRSFTSDMLKDYIRVTVGSRFENQSFLKEMEEICGGNNLGKKI